MQIRTLAVAMLAAVVPLCASAPAAAATIQVVSGSGQRAFVLGFFGNAAGQSFTAVDTTLNAIGFQFEQFNPGNAAGAYTLSLFAGETLTGTALFSQVFNVPTTVVDRTPVWVDVAIGAVGVVAGQRYTAVLNSADTRYGVVLGPDINIFTGVPLTGDAYAGGRALFATVPYPNCNNTASSACDLNFRVTGTTAVAAVPEPASWALMIGGFGLVGGALRRRRAAFANA